MLRANLTGPHTIELQERPIPEIKDSEVLLKVLFVGICGSDIQMYHGKHKYMTFPVVFTNPTFVRKSASVEASRWVSWMMRPSSP